MNVMSDNTHLISPFCPRFHHAVELVGRRWSGAILRALMSGATRFSDIQAAVPGLSDRLVSERLKELDAEGIVERIVIPETPVRIEYRLTEKGLALLPAIEALSEWAENWLEGIPDTGHNSESEDVAANIGGELRR
jgi:DNA-binding HxlR family transcriptional regulator